MVDNIFDTASKTLSKHKKVKEKGAPAPTKKPPIKPVTPDVKIDPETEGMIRRMNEITDDIKGQLEKMYRQHGVTEEQVRKYLSNPKNFTPFEWKQMQAAQNVLLAQDGMDSLAKSYAKKIEKVQKTKTPERLKKERKAKTLGARKQWMPVR